MTYLFNIVAGYRCAPEDVEPAIIVRVIAGIILLLIYIALVKKVFSKWKGLKAFPTLVSIVILAITLAVWGVTVFVLVPMGC